MLDQLAVAETARSFAALGAVGALTPDTDLPKPEGVFPRYVVEDGTERQGPGAGAGEGAA